MEFNEMLISTGVDALIKLVREKGKVELAIASRLLNIPVSAIEEWAHALEEEGIISIEYQLTKVYLRWVVPTGDQLSEEREALQAEKGQLMQEIKKTDEKSNAQLAELKGMKDEFGSGYKQVLAMIDDVSKKSLAISGLKSSAEERYYKALDSLDKFKAEVSEMGDSLASMREQIEKTRGEISSFDLKGGVSKLEESRKNVALLQSELASMEGVVSEHLRKLSTGGANASEIQSSIKEIRKDYSSFKKDMSEQFGAIKDGVDAYERVVRVEKQLGQVRESAKSASMELKSLSGSLEEIEARVAKASAIAKSGRADLAEIESSTAELDRKMGKIRIDKDVKSSLEKAVRAKQDLEERMEKLQSDISESAPLFENVDKLISSLSEVKKKISAEKKRLAEESGAIFSALDEEVANYSTFQKIKEKSDAKIADYLKQLEKIDADYGRISKETEKTTKEFEGSLAKFQGSSDYAKAQDLSEMVDRLMEKRALLEQIKSGMDSLDASAEKVSRQVKLLSKEVELVQFRASSSHEEAREGTQRMAENVHENISLTENEQKDFDDKRDELRKLIKKLWEDQ